MRSLMIRLIVILLSTLGTGSSVFAALPGVYSFKYDGYSYSVTVNSDGKISRVYVPGWFNDFSGSALYSTDLKLSASGSRSKTQTFTFWQRKYGTSFSVTYDGLKFNGSLKNYDTYYGNGPSWAFEAWGPYIYFQGDNPRSISASEALEEGVVEFKGLAGGLPPLISSNNNWLQVVQTEIISGDKLRYEFYVTPNLGSTSRTGYLTFDYNGVYSTSLRIVQDPPPRYELNVTNGSGDGSYTFLTPVKVTADTAPVGQKFAGWTVTPAVYTRYLDNVLDSSTTFYMPEHVVTLTATYEALPPVSLITISGPSNVNRGMTAAYTCTASYSDASTINVTST